MKALKFIHALFTEPKFEAAWTVIFLVAFVHHIASHATHTADGWNVTLAGWNLAYAILTAYCVGTSGVRALQYLRKGRA